MYGVGEVWFHGDWAIVDGYDGLVILNPSEGTLFRYGKIQEQKKSFEARLLEVNRQPAVTLDGVTVSLMANLGQRNYSEHDVLWSYWVNKLSWSPLRS